MSNNTQGWLQGKKEPWQLDFRDSEITSRVQQGKDS